ncbi:MAG: alginate lyase family protein [Marinilabiliaceae bacterium]|nr:alginate lyase family protein [Marinilabiliaceae bacterium]
MKRKILLAVFIWPVLLFAQNFNHPGLLHTQEDFERIITQLAANEPAVVAGYNNLKNNEWSQSNVTTWPVEIIKRGIAGDENYINAARGAHAAYMNALRWKISGDVAHANRAVYILNSWAAVTKALGGNTNVSLASGLYGYEFANAAELMRDYVGWNRSDFKKFQNWMQTVWYPYVYDFLSRRHDTWKNGTPGHYWSNWGLCNVLAMISIGILCDDEYIYNQGIAYYKYDKIGTFKDDSTLTFVDNWGLTEFIGNLVPVVHKDNRSASGYLGQMQESGRDQGHATMGLGLAVDICQIAWNQGDDLYGYMDNRLLAGLEFVAAYNSGTDDLPWTDYWYHDVRTTLANSWKQTGPNSSARGQFRPYWDRILGHYKGVKGINLNFAHKMADLVIADGGGGGSTSGGYDHLGYSTLTCTRPAISFSKSPLSLETQIVYQGDTIRQGELNNVSKGSTLKLIPVLPDTATDTGNWLWSSGETSKNLEITADSSSLYRVTYTNENGIKSTQLFSISVHGDCRPDVYYYSTTSSEGVVNDTIITVRQYSKVILSVSASSWHSTYLWNTGETSGAVEVLVGNEDRIHSVTGKNMGGAESTINFHVHVEPLGHSFKIGDGDVIYRDKVTVVVGQTVTLMPTMKPGMEGGSWLWSTGETSQNKVLENIQEASEITIIYSKDGTDYPLTFSIIVVPNENSFSYWPMDETDGTIAQDIWCGNHGNINSCIWTETGKYNGGIKFDGAATSYVKLPDNFISTLNDFTISVWVKPDVLDMWARVFDFGVNTNYNMFLTTKAGDGFVRFAIKAGGSEQQITTTKTPSTVAWTHIAITKSGNTAKIYINGVLAGSNGAMSINPSDLGITTQNYIGKSQWPDPLYKGTIDELLIYKTALSQSEITQLMEGNLPTELPNINYTAPEMLIVPTISSSGNFNLHSPGSPAFVSVFDMSGNIVKEFTTSAQNTSFYLSESKLYLVRVRTEKTSEVFKIIKN